jgi:hypothetical protein
LALLLVKSTSTRPSRAVKKTTSYAELVQSDDEDDEQRQDAGEGKTQLKKRKSLKAKNDDDADDADVDAGGDEGDQKSKSKPAKKAKTVKTRRRFVLAHSQQFCRTDEMRVFCIRSVFVRFRRNVRPTVEFRTNIRS